MRIVDGSIMEGGGQLLRMAVAYSAILGEPVCVSKIRAGRGDPGLKPQHLTTLRALAEISGAETRGLEVGSREIEFHPAGIRGGDYRFDIGTAGSVGLLLQCLAPVAAFADAPVRLRVRGGTAVRWSPPAAIVGSVVWPALARMGFRGGLEVAREGFYPKGGGEVEAEIAPIRGFTGIRLDRRTVTGIKGLSVAGRLPRHVAERQARSAEKVLSGSGYSSDIEIHSDDAPPSPGSYICLWVEGEAFIGADALGERGKTAERVGEEAAGKLLAELAGGSCVDQHTADNLILPCSLADGESVFTTGTITQHTLTAVEQARLIIGAEIRIEERRGTPNRITVKGKSISNPTMR